MTLGWPWPFLWHSQICFLLFLHGWLEAYTYFQVCSNSAYPMHSGERCSNWSSGFIIIIIITLFQEDNLFGLYVGLTYGPQLQRYACHWQLNRHELFTVCTEQVRSPYTEHAASGLPSPTQLEGEIRFVQAQDQQVVTTRSPRIIPECLLTRSMLIKIYVRAIYSWLCIGTILSNRKHECELIITITIKFVESFRS